MPIIDFQDLDEYDAAIGFLVERGISFHTRPPQQLQVTADICLRWALKDASDLHIIPPEAFFYDPAAVP